MRYSSRDFEIEAWVETLHDKKRFKEHKVVHDKDEETDEPTGLVTSFLECTEGEAFRVKFKCIRPATPHPDMRISVTIDGREIRGRAWTAKHKEADVGLMYVVDENGQSKAADLVFSKLPTVGDVEAAEVRGAALDPLCKIEVTIRHGQYKRLSEDNDYPRSMTDAKIGQVYEEDLKICSTIQAANLRVTKQKPGLVFTPDEEDPDVCYFRWNYYTHAKLKAMGLFKTAKEKEAEAIEQKAFNAAMKRLAEDPEYNDPEDCIITGSSKRVKMERIEAEEEEEAEESAPAETQQGVEWTGLSPDDAADGPQLDVDQPSSPMPEHPGTPRDERARSPAAHLPSSPLFAGEGEDEGAWSPTGLDRDDSPLFEDPEPQATSPVGVPVAELQLQSSAEQPEEDEEPAVEESVVRENSQLMVEDSMPTEESVMPVESAQMEMEEETQEAGSLIEAESNQVAVLAQ